jgi:hypothetical protein
MLSPYIPLQIFGFAIAFVGVRGNSNGGDLYV